MLRALSVRGLLAGNYGGAGRLPARSLVGGAGGTGTRSLIPTLSLPAMRISPGAGWAACWRPSQERTRDAIRRGNKRLTLLLAETRAKKTRAGANLLGAFGVDIRYGAPDIQAAPLPQGSADFFLALLRGKCQKNILIGPVCGPDEIRASPINSPAPGAGPAPQTAWPLVPEETWK